MTALPSLDTLTGLLEKTVATLTIRGLDEPLKLKLRLRAAGKNRSMEEEARQILRAALQDPTVETASFVSRIRDRFSGLGDVQLPIEPRVRDFDGCGLTLIDPWS